MGQDSLKRQVAEAALSHVVEDELLGIGSGSTVDCFIDALAASPLKNRILGTVAASEVSAERLRGYGIPVVDLNQADRIPVYIDGADETNPRRQLIKGGGGALTREKIIAAVSERFICIADASKKVDVLGKFPLPIEVIPMARSFIARKLVALGARPQWREGFITDNGNHILDVHQLMIPEPISTERDFNNWPGVVTVGLFALRPADHVLLAAADGIETF